MAKTIIIDSLTGSRTPFLRGILTRSLQNSGLPFEKAYQIASTARDELGELMEFESLALREMVVDLLGREGLFECISRYSEKLPPAGQLSVIDHDGTVTVFSISESKRLLMSCGLTMEESTTVIGRLIDSLKKEEKQKLLIDQIEYRIYKILHHEFGPPYDSNYLVWKEFTRSGKPLLLLIGGATGSGKSTIATEIAHSLSIIRTQSSDMLREVMRIMIPPKLMPGLHTSSFNAWSTLPTIQEKKIPEDKELIDGFTMQAEYLSVCAEAVFSRALKERVSLILEGIHIQPSFLDKMPVDPDSVVVMVMLAVLKQGQLKKQIRGRGEKIPGRRAKRYLKSFNEIWSIQSYLLGEADRYEVPIVVNDDKERATSEIMSIVVSQLAKTFTATPEDLFG